MRASEALTARTRVLDEAGLRKTRPRLAVLEVLERATAPLSHGEVADALTRAGFDRATVYRNLLTLTEAGLARRTDLGDHVWRFELVRAGADKRAGGKSARAGSARGRGAGPMHGHPHFVCVDCGDVECLEEVKVSFAGPGSPLLRRGEIHVRGTCDDCATPRARRGAARR